MYLETLYNIRLLDSFNVIVQTPLRNLQEIYGFAEQNGDFPYLFNKAEYYEYKVKKPCKEYYGYKRKTKEQADIHDCYKLIQDK